ncbi:MAG: tRNA (N6-threonylcarbamoyladenosine(37)-N6)-methyltransferase TrmO [Gemmatimonadaceae bacterium]
MPTTRPSPLPAKPRGDALAVRHGTFPLTVIGSIESTLLTTERAPRQGSEGAPDAWIVLDAAYTPGLTGISVGDDLVVVTWLHRASRAVLEVYPRDEPRGPQIGVFGTRSPHRPNPLGLHRVKVREIVGTRLRIGPMEAINGTPVVDVKAVLSGVDD